MALGHAISDIPDVLSVRVGDQVENWVKLDHKYFSHPHPLYPVDPAVVRAFREEFDPTMVPLWVRNRYLRPNGETIVFDRHVIATYDPALTGVELELGQFEWTGDFHQRPNRVFDIIERGKNPLCSDLPGLYGPLDFFSFYNALWMKAAMAGWATALPPHLSQEEITKRIMLARKTAKEAFYSKLREDIDYRWDNEWDSIQQTKTYYT